MSLQQKENRKRVSNNLGKKVSETRATSSRGGREQLQLSVSLQTYCIHVRACIWEGGVVTVLLNKRETTGRAHPHMQKRLSSQTLIYET